MWAWIGIEEPEGLEVELQKRQILLSICLKRGIKSDNYKPLEKGAKEII